MTHFHLSAHRQSGLSLVELLIALTIGLLLLAGLTLIFVNSSEANRELQKTAQQIENGRYAMDIITQDLHHAGYYGHFYDMSAITGLASPDPCETASTANLKGAIATPVQGFRAADLVTPANVTATTCDDKGLLTTANLRPGSDVLVVRRASTAALAVGATAVQNEIYIQANGVLAEVQTGNGAALGAGKKTDGGTAIVFFKDGVTAAPVRKYVVHVYFVAPCSVGLGANGVCTGNPPEDTIPTLKRLELGSVGGATTMSLVPLVEGIEYLKVEYGLDQFDASGSAAASIVTGQGGDSTVESYSTAPADWSTVIGAKVYILARNNTGTAGFIDDKSYTLGAATVAAANDNFKRHAFASAIRLVNLAGRRELP